MKGCSIAVKIPDRFEFCRTVFYMTFSHRGMNVCPICDASLSHHTFLYGKFDLVLITAYRPACVTYRLFHWLAKTKKLFTLLKKRVTAPILNLTYDPKTGYFFGLIGRVAVLSVAHASFSELRHITINCFSPPRITKWDM